jgi:hypothetical protein
MYENGGKQNGSGFGWHCSGLSSVLHDQVCESPTRLLVVAIFNRHTRSGGRQKCYLILCCVVSRYSVTKLELVAVVVKNVVD